MITLKTSREIALMEEGGQVLGRILEELLNLAQPGVKLTEIETRAEELIQQKGGTPSFKTVEGYNWATCLCVNQMVVHGIPTEYPLKEGDLLTVDIGMLYRGWHTDTAWTKIIRCQASDAGHQADDEKEQFLKIGEEALQKAVSSSQVGNRVGQISSVIQSTVESAGYQIVKSLVGHGIGNKLHEPPQIPGFLKGRLEDTPLVEPGMTLAIEVIYAMGSGAIIYENDDGWTLSTRDRSLAAVFEHTIAATSSGPVVLTKPRI